MTRQSAARLAVLSILILPMVVASSEPLPPPSHGFLLEGHIQRASAGSLAHYTVIPLAWRSERFTGVTVGCGDLDELFTSRTVTLTNSDGRFQLEFWTCGVPDTLSVAVVSPDTLIVGSLVPMNSLRGSYEQIDGDWKTPGQGCDSGTNTRYVRGYLFDADSLVIRVP